MAKKRILIADAEATAGEEARRALGDSWTAIWATSAGTALAEAEKEPFDVVVANFDLPETGGAELLNRIRVSHPQTVRFIAAAEAEKDRIVRDTAGDHHFMAAPFDAAAFKGAIDRSVTTGYGMSGSMRELVGRIRTFPAIPSLYLEVVNALKDPNATTDDIGNIVAKDMAMTTKLMQVLNSAYYGLPRTITDPAEAVGILGFETVKSLVMTIKLLSQYDNVKPVYFSMDSIWRHSTNVARAARAIALLETGDAEISSAAYTAGLMHDLGKVILAANFDSQYQGAHAIAGKHQIPLWEVEKDIFGASHGEMGAYLLNLWGMSNEVVNVAALHHHPGHSGDKAFSPLTAVHAANALEYEGATETDGLPAPVIDTIYLQTIGLEDRVKLWRKTHLENADTQIQTRPEHAKSTAPVPAAGQLPDRPVTVESAARASRSQWMWRLLGMGLGACAVLAFLVRLEITSVKHETDNTAMDDAAAPQTAAMVPSVQAPTETKRVVPTSKADTEISATETMPAAIAQPQPMTPPATEKTGFDRLKLEAIFFSTQHPAAVINGQITRVDQVVADCRVLDITPGSVTLEYQNQRKTLTMR